MDALNHYQHYQESEVPHMSGRFMNIKRIVIPTITMVIIASQLMGCAAVSQSELLQMINQGDAIEIEVATPINQEQGTESALDWQELASLTTNDTLRDSWDDILMITPTDTGKNGVLYVNVEGNNEPNNTLRVALHNSEFLKYLDSEADSLQLSNAVQGNYADLEENDTARALYMGINGYFNLLPDANPNYANPDSTLQRNEFMAMVFRAETPVQDLTPDTTFADAVGQSDYNIYAQGLAGNSYLDTASKSLNNLTANGTITRAEALYLLASRYFADDMASVDVKTATFNDAKDGGDIAAEQKFIEDGTQKDYWKSYELTYAIQNPDDGLPTDLYKALVVAKAKGLITDTTRWDEALTKSEAIEFLVKTLRQEKGIEQFNAKQGLVAGHEVTEPAKPEEVTDKIVAETQAEAEYVDYVQDQASANNKDESDMEESDIEPLDKVMYATGNINTRSGPSVDFKKVGGLTVNQEVKVTGQSKTTNWYEIEVNGAKQYVSDKLLSDNKVEVSKPSSNNNGGGNGGNGSGNGGGSTTPSGSDGQKLMDALKQLGIDPNDDVSNDVAAPAPTPGGHRSSGEGIEFY